MAWTVQLAAAAEKTLQNIASGDPRRMGDALQGDERAWRYRVGDWRIICDLADASSTIYVVRIGHRSDVYRN